MKIELGKEIRWRNGQIIEARTVEDGFVLRKMLFIALLAAAGFGWWTLLHATVMAEDRSHALIVWDYGVVFLYLPALLVCAVMFWDGARMKTRHETLCFGAVAGAVTAVVLLLHLVAMPFLAQFFLLRALVVLSAAIILPLAVYALFTFMKELESSIQQIAKEAKQ